MSDPEKQHNGATLPPSLMRYMAWGPFTFGEQVMSQFPHWEMGVTPTM